MKTKPKRPSREQRAAEEFTGSDNVLQAFQQWKKERAAMLELHEDKKALFAKNTALLECVTLAQTAFLRIEKDAGMLISDKTRKTVERFHEQVNKVLFREAQ